MNYKSMLVTRRGGLEALQVIEKERREPGPGEAQIRVLASAVVQDDIAARVGNRPFLRKPPFVPGYSFIGQVEAVGDGVSEAAVGDRVAALTRFDSHSELIYWPAAELVQVPEHLDLVKAAPLILNYLVAYQTLHRVAQVTPGDKILIVGASGGCGTAFLQLGRLAGLKMYGLASPKKHQLLTDHGAIPVDYHRDNWPEAVRDMEPGGLDYVFNGMAEDYLRPCLSVLKQGGLLVHYGAPQSIGGLLRLLFQLGLSLIRPDRKRIAGYGTHRLGTALFQEDWAYLFSQLEAGSIKPVILATFPLLEAPRAYQLLASGQVVGNVVLSG